MEEVENKVHAEIAETENERSPVVKETVDLFVPFSNGDDDLALKRSDEVELEKMPPPPKPEPKPKKQPKKDPVTGKPEPEEEKPAEPEVLPNGKPVPPPPEPPMEKFVSYLKDLHHNF